MSTKYFIKNLHVLFLLLLTFNLAFSQGEFITVWETSNENESITIPTIGGGYNYTVDWGDGTTDTNLTGDATHIYTEEDEYEITITGDFPRIYFNNSGDKHKILLIEQWGDQVWTSMNGAFHGCLSMELSLGAGIPNLSNVSDMQNMFAGCTDFNTNINNWDVSALVNGANLFKGCTSYNQPLNNWNMPLVTNLSGIFEGCTSLNSPGFTAANMNSAAVDASFAYSGCSVYDQPTDWPSQGSRESMFKNCFSFNSPVAVIDGSTTATSAEAMFKNCSAFNQPVTLISSNGNPTSVAEMFAGCSAFEQDLSSWIVEDISSGTDFMDGAGLSTANYDALLSSWSAQTLNYSNINISFGNSTFCNSTSARALLDNDWGIQDGGLDTSCIPQNEFFITTWTTTSSNESITIPIFSGETYEYLVDWGDGSYDFNQTGNATHTYVSPGTYTVRIHGTFPRIYFNNTGDKDKLISIEQWGSQQWISMERAFIGCTHLTVPALDAPDLSQVVSMRQMFTLANALETIPAVDQWDVSNVEDMEEVFSATMLFNGDISSWDVSNVTNMNLMFSGALAFNQDISSWNVSNVTNMGFMFAGAPSFNQNLGGWDISSLTDASNMFDGTNLSTFNYDNTLIGWNTLDVGAGETQIPVNISLGASGVTFCEGANARAELESTYNWNISDAGEAITCSNALEMIFQTTSVNESITIPTIGAGYDYTIDWGDGIMETNLTGNTTHIYSVAGNYTVKIAGDFPRIYFNNSGDKDKLISIEQWGNQQWTSMERAFYGCSNMTLSTTAGIPNLSSVSNMSYMFAGCSSFNTNINNWNPSALVNGSHLFDGCISFNQPMNNWQTPLLTNLTYVFANCTSYNSPTLFTTNNTSSHLTASYAFYNCTSYNQPTYWPEKGRRTSMFENCTVFNSPVIDIDCSGAPCDPKRMFKNCQAFNRPVGLYSNTPHQSNISEMFAGCSSFDQDLGGWYVQEITVADNFMYGVTLSTENYDALLNSWSTQPLPYSFNISFGNSQFCAARDARSVLTDSIGWNITDGGRDFSCLSEEDAFITTWTTTTANESITIPTAAASTYDYDIEWGDGSSDIYQTGSVTHIYANPGTYTVKIHGDFSQIYFNNSGDKDKLISIEQWGSQQWTSMERAFYGCSNMILSSSAGIPNLNNVSNMSYMFAGCTSFNTNINNWNPSALVNGSHLFDGCTSFNQPMNNWQTPLLTNLTYVFANCTSYNSPTLFTTNNTSSHLTASYAFYNCTSYNQPTYWPEKGRRTSMFENCTVFNSPVIDIDCSGAPCDPKRMFKNCQAFNRPVGLYSNTPHQSNISEMFAGCSSFDQDLGGWYVQEITVADNFMYGVTLSTENYDALLNSWSTQPLPYSFNISFGNSQYCAARDARSVLTDSIGWNITDGGRDFSCLPEEDAFITIWTTTTANESITIPTAAASMYDYDIEWGDGSSDTYQTGSVTHIYANPGTYTVKIHGDFPQIYFNNTGDKDKIMSVEQWGTQQWSSMYAAFYGCSNLTVPATDVPDLSQLTGLGFMFRGCSSIGQPPAIGSWDVSNISFFGQMFRGSSFNQDISNWDMSSANNIRFMFAYANDFNHDLSSWNVSNATDFVSMFQSATSFNQDLGDWDLSSAGNMSAMLNNAGLSKDNYDATLIGWASLDAGETQIPINITLGASTLEYCQGNDAREDLVDAYDWNISGDTKNCIFTTLWSTSFPGTSGNNTITIPTLGSGYNYTVNWKKLTGSESSGTAGPFTGDAVINFPSGGIYRVEIIGSFPRIYFNNGGDRERILAVENWGDNVWTSMENAFYGCSNLEITAFNDPDLSQVTSMAGMFRSATAMNGSLDTWDVSNVQNMSELFLLASNFNQDIGSWDVGNVTDMEGMFNRATAFNQDIGSWDVSKVTDMSEMFVLNSVFNQDISTWDVSSVENMSFMFQDAINFNADIANWDVSSVTNMNSTFLGSDSFDQNLGSWDISSVSDMTFMLKFAGLSVINYDSTLIGWNTLDVDETQIPQNITLGADGLSYCEGEQARAELINTHGWTIDDTGVDEDCPYGFVTKWRTLSPNESVTIPTTGTGYDYLVDWGDGTVEFGFTGNASHTYDTAGTYTVRITGDFPRIYFNDGNQKSKIYSVEKWGDNAWTSMNSAFEGCFDLTITATDTPDLSQVTDMSSMFKNASSFNQDISTWDVSNVTHMSNMFEGAGTFNQDINSWDVSNVEDMSYMFSNANSFNQDLNNWNVANVSNLNGMFFNAILFNGDVTSWDIGGVDSLYRVFMGANDFNQPIGSWDVSGVTNMTDMFRSAVDFNQDLSSWDLSQVNSIFGMFLNAIAFNQDIGSWDVSNVTDMTATFYEATSFDQDLGDWDISSVTSMPLIFDGSNLSTVTYDSILIGWNRLDLGETQIPTNLTLDAFGATYCLGENARNTLIDTYDWTVTDAGAADDCQKGFSTKWELTSDNEVVTITTSPSFSYDYSIDWGDGTFETGKTGTSSHSYATAGIYQIQIFGEFPRPDFESEDRLIEIIQWGDIVWMDFTNSFRECNNLIVSANDAPNLSNVTSLSNMFYNCPLEYFPQQAFANWDVSTITNMAALFGQGNLSGSVTESINVDLSNWDVSNVVTMAAMFSNQSNLVDVGFDNWDVSAVQSMDFMFYDCSGNIQGDISGWNTESLISTASMFELEVSSDILTVGHDLSNWDMSQVQNMSKMFRGLLSFDEDLSNWDVSSATDMTNMFDQTGLSVINYDNILTAWSQLPNLQSNVNLGAAEANFCAVEERNYLIDSLGWTIIDDGPSPDCTNSFVTEWELYFSGHQITLYTDNNFDYNYSVDWGDGTFVTGRTGNSTHAYSTPGFYKVQIFGKFPRASFSEQFNLLKILQWGDIEWQELDFGFSTCTDLVLEANDAPDLSQVNSLKYTFQDCKVGQFSTVGLSNWDVSTISNIEGLFSFSQNINGGENVNLDLSNWDVSNVGNMNALFANAGTVDAGISSWNVSNVWNMGWMFSNVDAVNDDISGWNTSNVINMERLFRNVALPPDVSSWDVSKVWNFKFTFASSSQFNQDLSNWNVSSATNMTNMFNGTALSKENYDNILISWSQIPGLKSNVNFGAAGVNFCIADTERQYLVDQKNWTITDAGKDEACASFMTTWETTDANQTITIPTTGTGYNYTVDWGDGAVDSSQTGNASHSYANAGIYQVVIYGDFPRIYFNNDNVGGSNNKLRIKSIDQWGEIVWSSMNGAFWGCTNLTVPATDAPDLTLVSDMNQMFRDVISLVDIPAAYKWDVSNVEEMSSLFYGATLFNGDLSTWDVGNVEYMNSMFKYTNVFNQNISSWDVSKVEEMQNMFEYALAFNQDISGWDVSNVTDMSGLFSGAVNFNQDISTWDVSNVVGFENIFSGASSFDQNLGPWDLSNVGTIASSFSNSGMSTASYDSTLIGWSTLDPGEGQIPTNTSLFATGINYCLGAAARDKLINDYGWNIQDAGSSCCPNRTEYINGAWDNGIPNAMTEAIISDNYDTAINGGSIEACRVTVNSGYTLTVNDGDNLNFQIDLVIKGNVRVKPNGSVTTNENE